MAEKKNGSRFIGTVHKVLYILLLSPSVYESNTISFLLTIYTYLFCWKLKHPEKVIVSVKKKSFLFKITARQRLIKRTANKHINKYFTKIVIL